MRHLGTPMLVRLLVRLNLTNMASHLVRQWDSWWDFWTLGETFGLLVRLLDSWWDDQTLGEKNRHSIKNISWPNKEHASSYNISWGIRESTIIGCRIFNHDRSFTTIGGRSILTWNLETSFDWPIFQKNLHYNNFRNCDLLEIKLCCFVFATELY